MPGGQFSHLQDNEPRPGHGTQWVNSGTILAIPVRLASLSRNAAKMCNKCVQDKKGCCVGY